MHFEAALEAVHWQQRCMEQTLHPSSTRLRTHEFRENLKPEIICDCSQRLSATERSIFGNSHCKSELPNSQKEDSVGTLKSIFSSKKTYGLKVNILDREHKASHRQSNFLILLKWNAIWTSCPKYRLQLRIAEWVDLIQSLADQLLQFFCPFTLQTLSTPKRPLSNASHLQYLLCVCSTWSNVLVKSKVFKSIP